MSRTTPMTNQGVLVGVPQSPWKLLRAAGPENSTAALTVALAHEYQALVAGSLASELIDLQAAFGNTFSWLSLAFFSDTYSAAAPADGDTAGIEIYGYAQDMGNYCNMPTLIAYTATAGMIVGTATVPSGLATNGLWFDTVDIVGSAEVNDSGTNRVASVFFQPCGMRFILPVIWGALGAQAGEAPSVGIIGRVW